MVGKTVGGRYRLEHLLGQGGMSAVYKAMDPNLRRVVAVKLIHPHLSDNSEFVRRFEEEAAAVAQLRHPNIIQVYDFNHDDGMYYMVLEFVPGETLQHRLEQLNDAGRRMPYSSVVRYASGVCEAVDYAHRRGMVHRDIKPANIIIDPNDQAILMDFGIAKIVGATQHTATGAVVGTALYMSPEQIRGEKLDGRSDLYSVGVTLYEMLSGQPPFNADSVMSLMMMHLNTPAPDLRSLRPGVPEGLVKVVEKALAKDPADRYQSGAEMTAALRRELDVLQTGSATAGEAVQLIQPTLRQSPSGHPLAAGISIVGPTAASTAAVNAANMGTAGIGTASAGIATGTGTVGGAYPAAPTGIGVGESKAHTTGLAGITGAIEGLEPGKRKLVAASGCLVGLGVLVFIVAVFGLFLSQRARDRALVARQGEFSATQTVIQQTRVVLDAMLTPVAVTPTALQPAETSVIAAEPTLSISPTIPPSPTALAVVPPTVASTPTATSGQSVLLVSVKLEGDVYIVEYETVGFIERAGGRHLHFFFNTGTPDNIQGDSQFVMFTGPRPFQGLTVFDRPDNATQICAIIANPDHSTIPGTANCIDLPPLADLRPTGIPPATAEKKDKYDY